MTGFHWKFIRKMYEQLHFIIGKVFLFYQKRLMKIQERMNISWSGRNKFELKVHA